jgi:hypothetical protein
MSDNPRPRFDRLAFATLKQAAVQAMDEVPELALVGIVCLWDFPDQSSLPTASLVGRDGSPPSPDEIVRMMRATIRFQEYLLGLSAQAVVGLGEMVDNLARAAAHGQTQTRTGAGPPRPAADPAETGREEDH